MYNEALSEELSYKKPIFSLDFSDDKRTLNIGITIRG
jgi:hypothetical protein